MKIINLKSVSFRSCFVLKVFGEMRVMIYERELNVLCQRVRIEYTF